MRGPWTLFVREMRRFLKVPGQTLLSPAVTTALYLAVFGYAVAGRGNVGGVPYIDFIVPGLIMLGVISNAFLNSSSSMFAMKLQGNIVDLLVTPLGGLEMTGAMVAAAMARAGAIGMMTWLTAVVVRGVHVAHPLFAIAFPTLTGIGFGAIGLLSGLWAEKFEHLNAIPAFVITPLTFLGGVFYDVRGRTGVMAVLSRLDPIFYIVDGMRYGLVGHAVVAPWLGLAVLTAADAFFVMACVIAIGKGWKLRS
jgi:ABC-2 type transport system permease protein